MTTPGLTTEMDAGDGGSRLCLRHVQNQRSLQIAQIKAFVLTQINKNALLDAPFPEQGAIALALSIII